jgi:Mitochondrial carrier protein
LRILREAQFNLRITKMSPNQGNELAKNGHNEEEKKIKLNFRMFASGFCMALIFQPFEVVRTTLVMNKQLRQMKDVLNYIYQKEGMAGFLKGAQMSVIRSSINGCLFFMTIDYFNGYKKIVLRHLGNFPSFFLFFDGSLRGRHLPADLKPIYSS